MVFLLMLMIGLFVLELIYFKLADQYNIIDKPNERSSHSAVTLRGGGILFPIAWLLYFVGSGGQLPYVTMGVLLVSLVSFIDDIQPLDSKLRLVAHLLAFTLCFVELQVFSQWTWYGIVALYILCIGCINAINFMDGINGMTGMYALSIILPLGFEQFNRDVHAMDSHHSLPYILISILVFGFFNFRKKAKCFAGDVGSVGLGFILIYTILYHVFYFSQLPLKNGLVGERIDQPVQVWFILFLGVYGIDSILTIVQRLWNKENIFKPHRKHLYQYLANELKWPHMLVSLLYAGIQLTLNSLLITKGLSPFQGWVILGILIAVYVTVKFQIQKRFRLT